MSDRKNLVILHHTDYRITKKYPYILYYIICSAVKAVFLTAKRAQSATTGREAPPKGTKSEAFQPHHTHSASLLAI